MIRLIIILQFLVSCGSFSKIENHRQVDKKQRHAEDLFILAEKYRREKNYAQSLKKYFLAADIYRSKFDYVHEAQIMAKIGYIYSRVKNKSGVNQALSRLDSIKKNYKGVDDLINALKIRESYAFYSPEHTSKLILEIIPKLKGVKKRYYEAMYVKLNGYDDSGALQSLLGWRKSAKSQLDKLNDIKNPEAFLYINKVLASFALKNRDKELFDRSTENCEKLINYFELVEYSSSIRILKNSWPI